MIAQIQNIDNDIFGVEVTGNITTEDYHRLNPIMQSYKKSHGKFKLLIIAHDFAMSPGAMWEDLHMGLQYMHHIKKAVLVSNGEWLENAMGAIKAISPGIPVKSFSLEKRSEALKWLGN